MGRNKSRKIKKKKEWGGQALVEVWENGRINISVEIKKKMELESS